MSEEHHSIWSLVTKPNQDKESLKFLQESQT